MEGTRMVTKRKSDELSYDSKTIEVQDYRRYHVRGGLTQREEDVKKINFTLDIDVSLNRQKPTKKIVDILLKYFLFVNLIVTNTSTRESCVGKI